LFISSTQFYSGLFFGTGLPSVGSLCCSRLAHVFAVLSLFLKPEPAFSPSSQIIASHLRYPQNITLRSTQILQGNLVCRKVLATKEATM